MPLELGLWRIEPDANHRIHPASLDLEARLEEILHRDISIIAPNWMVIGRQVRTIHGKLIDLLCMDRDGNLVVVELKRGMTDREIVSQLLDYGSWIRTLRDEEIARIFDAYWKKYHPSESLMSINEAFCARFGVKEMPEELNESHELVIVGAEFDPSTERIVDYLASEYDVRINAVFFRVFKDGDREYLTRVWLRDPTLPESAAEAAEGREATEWNGEYYVSFGPDPHRRNWEDAVKYGFVSGGGGTWYSQTLHMLEPGSRFWVHVPGGVGYVGVGVVEEPMVKVDDFMVEGADGNRIPITQAPIKGKEIGKHSDDPERAEYLVRVRWLKTLPLDKAVREKGFFGNQNTVARPSFRQPVQEEFTFRELRFLRCRT
jgi:hypothetical protein